MHTLQNSTARQEKDDHKCYKEVASRRENKGWKQQMAQGEKVEDSGNVLFVDLVAVTQVFALQ